MKMNAFRLGLALGIVVLVVAPALSIPVSSSSEQKVVPITCSVVKQNGGAASVQKAITVKDAKILSQKMNEAAQSFRVLYSNSSDEEKDRAREIIENAVNMLVDLGIVPAEYATYLVNVLLWPCGTSHGFDIFTPIISVGQGCSWIPLYPGEAFLGMMLRPIFVLYPMVGYTGSLSANLIPPRIEYWDLVGPQVFMAWGFTGLYINFGKIGLGVPNTNFMLGYSIATAGISLL